MQKVPSDYLQNVWCAGRLIVKVGRWILTEFLYFVCGITIFLICWGWVAHSGFFSIDSFFTAGTFFPPFWIFILSLFSALGLLIKKEFKIALGLILSSALLMAFFEDYSLKPLLKKEEKISEGTKFSVLALNVQYYVQGLERVTSILKTLDADILLLSENILNSDEKKFLKSELFPFSVYIGPREGTAIVSRFPVVDVRDIELPTYAPSLSGFNKIEEQPYFPKRSFIHAVVDVKGTLVHVIAIRFIAGRGESHMLWDQLIWGRYLWENQVKEVMFFQNYLAELKGPIIFGGDLNAPPTSTTIRSLSRVAKDAYLTHHVWGAFTFRTEVLPTLRLDYVFFNKDLVSVSSEIVKLYVSDHHGVYAKFLISKGL